MRVLARPAFRNRHRNPYNWLLYSALVRLGVEVEEFYPLRLQILRRKYDIWHLHWPENMLRRSSQLAARIWALRLLPVMRYARLRGTKIIWTVHNLQAHDASHLRLEKWFWPAFTQRVHGYISLSQVALPQILDSFPALHDVPGFVVQHGHYRDVYSSSMGRSEARQRLDIPHEAKVVTFAGRVRPYKNVPRLIQVFRDLPDSHAMMLVAGDPSSAKLAQEIRSAAEGDRRIRLRLELVSDEDLQLFLSAADLVALPYQEVLNSGSALLALSFDRPVLLPSLGAMGELQQLVGEAWVRTYQGDMTSSHLEEALTWALETSRSERVPMDDLNWEKLAGETLNAYSALLA